MGLELMEVSQSVVSVFETDLFKIFIHIAKGNTLNKSNVIFVLFVLTARSEMLKNPKNAITKGKKCKGNIEIRHRFI